MSTYTDEIDLRPYILVLKKKWWQIALISLICAAAGFLFSLSQARKYEASALVLLTRNRAALRLAEDFPTSAEPVDFRSRIDAMLALGESDSLFTQTIADIKGEYPRVEDDFESFKDSVEISNSGDTIKISVSDPDPEYAALVANTVAKRFITTINYAYSGEQLPGDIQANLEPARNEYEAAQSDLEDFYKENQVDTLQKQVTETSNVLDELVRDHTWQVSYNIRRKQKMEQVLNEALALREQLSSSRSSTASNAGIALAILRLQAEAYRDDQVQRNVNLIENPNKDSEVPSQQTFVYESSAQSPDVVYNLQVGDLTDGAGGNTAYRTDLDMIINRAREEKNIAEENLSLLAKETLTTTDDESITAITKRLSDLRSQLEAETAQLTELTDQRDLKLNAYKALAQKETEVRNNLQTSALVTLASPAITPTVPVSRGLLRNTIIGGILGFFLGLVWVIGTYWLRSLDEQELHLSQANP